MARLQEDACDTCVEMRTKLEDPDLDPELRAALTTALENHGALARSLRGTMKSAIVLWAKRALGTASTEQMAALMDALDLLPANADEEPKPRPAVSCKVLLMAEDYAGNIVLPSYGLLRPGKDYYASNLLVYAFVQCDMSAGLNRVVMYDERGMGKDANALCSLRLSLHLRRQVEVRLLPYADRPTVLFQVMDNNVGQNKSELVFKFFALLSLTWYPDGVSLLYLLPGHSHMACDRVVGWIRKAIGKAQHFLPSHLATAMNNVANVEAEFLDHADPRGSMMLCNWAPILDNNLRSIGPLPAIKGYTKQYFFEFNNGLLTMRKEPTSDVVATHDYLGTEHGGPNQPTRAECKLACVRGLEGTLFTEQKTFETATVADVRVAVGDAVTDGVLSATCLQVHPPQDITGKKVESFWTKAGSIPAEHRWYYPVKSGTDAATSLAVLEGALTKQLTKKVNGHASMPLPAKKLSQHSIASWFAKPGQIAVKGPTPAVPAPGKGVGPAPAWSATLKRKAVALEPEESEPHASPAESEPHASPAEPEPHASPAEPEPVPALNNAVRDPVDNNDVCPLL